MLPPEDPAADYRVRIFTPDEELPFAGHPTLGTCHAWLEAGGQPRDPGGSSKACGAGLVAIQRGDDSLAFAAPPLLRSGPVDEADLSAIAATIGIGRPAIVDAQWGDNGPGWVIVLTQERRGRACRATGGCGCGPWHRGSLPARRPRQPWRSAAGTHRTGSWWRIRSRGSLNASAAGWLIASGRLAAPYIATQGAAIGRAGRVSITQDDAGTIWTGGRSVTVVAGTVDV